MNLKAQVQRIIFAKKNDFGDAWYILATDMGKCQGLMKWTPVDGERLELAGDWAVYKGEKEFKFTSVRPDLPVDSRVLLHYVCERTSGIGAKKEKLIWDTLKEEWTDIEPGDVPGLPAIVVDEFLRQYREILLHDEQFKAIAYLIGRGCTSRMAELAWDEWSSAAVGVVNDNCYRLTELRGYGFCHVDDTIRRNYKIGDTDPRRIRAGIIYAIQQVSTDGSTAIDVNATLAQALAFLKLDIDLIYEVAALMIAEGELVLFQGSEHICAKVNYKNEATIWNFGGQRAI